MKHDDGTIERRVEGSSPKNNNAPLLSVGVVVTCVPPDADVCNVT